MLLLPWQRQSVRPISRRRHAAGQPRAKFIVCSVIQVRSVRINKAQPGLTNLDQSDIRGSSASRCRPESNHSEGRTDGLRDGRRDASALSSGGSASSSQQEADWRRSLQSPVAFLVKHLKDQRVGRVAVFADDRDPQSPRLSGVWILLAETG